MAGVPSAQRILGLISLTWSFAHEHDSCIVGTLARDRLCAALMEFTFRALQDFGMNELKLARQGTLFPRWWVVDLRLAVYSVYLRASAGGIRAALLLELRVARTARP